MPKVSLDAEAREQLEQPPEPIGTGGDDVVGGHERVLRETVMALSKGPR